MIDFRPGLPALDLFPRKMWSQLVQRVYTEVASTCFGYDTSEGRSELRYILASYLLRTRGVQCHPDQIVITTGAAQALSLTAQLLLTQGSTVILEDPVTYEIQVIYASTGARLHSIEVDEYGLQTDLLPTNTQPAFVHVTPSHQFPLGGILPIQRRIQLIQFARSTGCYLVEDDYDSEFRFSGPPIGSLQGLEPERVIYIGTFSKILSPALRLGYMILPPPLVDACRQIKRFNDLHSPSLDQLILARFIEMGYLERHVVKMKRVYRKQRDTLIQSLQSCFADQVTILGDATGLHLVAAFHNHDFTTHDSVGMLKNAGVLVYPVEMHTIRKGTYRQHLVMGYSNLTCNEIVEGVKRIATTLNHT